MNQEQSFAPAQSTRPNCIPSGSIDPDFYNEYGYCHLRPQCSEFLGNIERAAAAFEDAMRTCVDEPFVFGFGNKDGKYRQLRYVHLRVPAFLNLMCSKEVQTIVNQVFGRQRMYVTHSKVSYKEVGQDLPWYPHQDNAYKRSHNLGLKDGMTIAVFLEDADVGNGTIQVFPGSHKLKDLPHSKSNDIATDAGQLHIEHLPDIEPEHVIAKKGDLLAFGFDLIHQSSSNMSHGYRPVFLIEIKPHEGLPMDERGRCPLILNGRLSHFQQVAYFVATRLRQIRAGFGVLRRFGLSSARSRNA